MNDEYPLLRRYVTKYVVDFCRIHNLSCVTERLSQDSFYDTVARSKIGISIGGGGYDTGRFWEILANNCTVLTEPIDIFPRSSSLLSYSRIHECTNLYDFAEKLTQLAPALSSLNFDAPEYTKEYADIMHMHSSVARVQTILEACHKKGII
jgi:hypothetical protein